MEWISVKEKLPKHLLIHYSHQPVKFLEKRDYRQDEGFGTQIKPNGLWFSIEDGYGWKDWCESEQFRTDGLKFPHEVSLKIDANILCLREENEVIAFHEEYKWCPFARVLNMENCSELIEGMSSPNWSKVKERYQGMAILNYRRLSHVRHGYAWYYGWDCSSGCIWDLDCIENFKCYQKD